MQGTWVHPQHMWTGTIKLWPPQTKRHRRSHRTRRRPERNPSPQSTQDQTRRQHQDLADRRRNEAIQSRLRQTRRWPQHLLIVSLWLRNTVHCPRRRPKSSPGCSVWWRRHDEHRTLVRSGLNKKCVFANHVVCRLFPVFDDVISGLMTSFPVPASLPCWLRSGPDPQFRPVTWTK